VRNGVSGSRSGQRTPAANPPSPQGSERAIFPTKPTTPPLPGATYGSFAAACHYKDGTFVPAPSQADCAKRSPQSGAAFNFWHPDLVTLHVWLWRSPAPAVGRRQGAQQLW
jgi:hypothetical protein